MVSGMQSFWKGLQRPFFAMAPMADVTDPAWRALVARRGKPDIFWTEFVSADGLYHTRELQNIPDADNPLMRDLLYSALERPIVAQFFTNSPERMAYAATLAEQLGFDGVDINMGCPVGNIVGQGAGSDLIRNATLAQDLIRAAQKASTLPVSVKTRIGYDQEELGDWLPALLETRPAAITLHLRTRKEMSAVPARWEVMREAVRLRDAIAPAVLLIGNGDVRDLIEARKKAAETGCDGVMIGRGMFGNPWVFAGKKAEDTALSEKLSALAELAYAFEALRPQKHFAILKKHIKAFVNGFDGAAELRAQLMEAENAGVIEKIVRSVERL